MAVVGALGRAGFGRIGLHVTLAGLLMSGSPAFADPLADAGRAYVAGNIAQARDTWLSLAHGGNAEAAYRLGLLAELGQGMQGNAADAYRWYRQAADAGNAAAEFNVAVMEDGGRGTAHDIADAATWYGRAAARGNSRAQYDLGLLYEAGDGVPQNPAAARAWFRLALAGGLPAAATKLHAANMDGSEQSGAAGSDMPRPALPVAPRNGAVVQTGADSSAEIVWCAPRQPFSVRYFLQVVTRDGGPEREIQTGYVDATATLVHLDPAVHTYFWRIFTVSPGHARYVVTPWNAFSLHGLA